MKRLVLLLVLGGCMATQEVSLGARRTRKLVDDSGLDPAPDDPLDASLPPEPDATAPSLLDAGLEPMPAVQLDAAPADAARAVDARHHEELEEHEEEHHEH